MTHPVYYVINYAILALNILVTIFCFGIRKKGRLPILFGAVAVLVFNLAVYFHPTTAAAFEHLPVSLLWFVLVYFLNEGRFFTKLFIYFSGFYITLFLYIVSSFVAEAFSSYGSTEYLTILTILSLSLFSMYGVLARHCGKRFCEKLFAYVKPVTWGYYMILPVTSLIIIGYAYETQGIIWHPLPVQLTPYYLLLPVFMFACYIFISTAIISTHNRVVALHELELTRSILSGGQGYYQRLTVLTEELQKMRHELMQTTSEKTNDYFSKPFCASRAVNALLYGYDERCRKDDIRFTVQIEIDVEINEYELCIIIGNLLENAVTAAQRTPNGENRYIDLVIRRHDAQFGIMVENSYDGHLNQSKDGLVSTKPPNRDRPTGIGINSIKTVAKKHNGDYFPHWDYKKFSAYVVLRLEENHLGKGV